MLRHGARLRLSYTGRSSRGDGGGIEHEAALENRFFSPGKLMLSSATDILKMAEARRSEGRGVAIATVGEPWGAAPRPVGSHLVNNEHTNFLGTVSGGC